MFLEQRTIRHAWRCHSEDLPRIFRGFSEDLPRISRQNDSGEEGLAIRWKRGAAVQAGQGAIRMRNRDLFRPLVTPSHQRNRGLTANYLITKKILLFPTLNSRRVKHELADYENLTGHGAAIPKIFRRSSENLPRIFRGFSEDLPRIFRGSPEDFPRIFRGSSENLPAE